MTSARKTEPDDTLLWQPARYHLTEARTILLFVRCTTTEREKVAQAARLAGMTIADFLRWAIHDALVVARTNTDRSKKTCRKKNSPSRP